MFSASWKLVRDPLEPYLPVTREIGELKRVGKNSHLGEVTNFRSL